MKAEQIKSIINEKIPIGSITTDHDDTGHYYKVGSERYSSVTTKLQILKDKSLNNYQTNRAIDYLFDIWDKVDKNNLQHHLYIASKQSSMILNDAGDIGSVIHDSREKYFRDWIDTGIRPSDVLKYIEPSRYDIRAVSALRALSKFIDENNYVPIETELMVWDSKLRVAGMLDDIGFMNGKFVLMDLKSSNQFKDHYFFQVALYYSMFKKLTGLRPSKCYILKVSKTDGTYKLEDLKQPAKLAQYAKYVVRVTDGINFIKSIRKDNQKKVIKI